MTPAMIQSTLCVGIASNGKRYLLEPIKHATRRCNFQLVVTMDLSFRGTLVTSDFSVWQLEHGRMPAIMTVTNLHFIDNCTRMSVHFTDGSQELCKIFDRAWIDWVVKEDHEALRVAKLPLWISAKIIEEGYMSELFSATILYGLHMSTWKD